MGVFGQSELAPMIAFVGDVCGWMAIDFFVGPYFCANHMLTQFNYLFIFGLTLPFLRNLFFFSPIFFKFIHTHSPTYYLASTYELTYLPP